MGIGAIQYILHTPSMRTLRASLSTLSVEIRTRMQKMNVHMGSAIVHLGCMDRNDRYINTIEFYACRAVYGLCMIRLHVV